MSRINQNTSDNGFNPADAFINVAYVNSQGQEVRFSKGIPLDADNPQHAAFINAAKANPEGTLSLVGKVHIVVPKADIPAIAIEMDTPAPADEEATAEA